MSKHTPGPWLRNYHVDFPGRIVIIGGPALDRRPVCHVMDSKADAALIAAAPDMLAALIALRDEYKQAIAALHMQSSRQLAWANADAVIAKATGGES